VYRHANSQSARVETEKQPDRITVRVRDHGVGVPYVATGVESSPRMGVGISGMRERVRQFGGELTVSRAESGTLVVGKYLCSNSRCAVTHPAPLICAEGPTNHRLAIGRGTSTYFSGVWRVELPTHNQPNFFESGSYRIRQQSVEPTRATPTAYARAPSGCSFKQEGALLSPLFHAADPRS